MEMGKCNNCDKDVVVLESALHCDICGSIICNECLDIFEEGCTNCQEQLQEEW